MSNEKKDPNIIIYLKHQGDLLYAVDNISGPFEPLEAYTIIGVSEKWVVQFECADDSIEKINSIDVNTNKEGDDLNWKDFWQDRPKKVDNSGRIFQGTIKSGIPQPQEFNGYTVKYKTEAGDKEKDPILKNPPQP